MAEKSKTVEDKRQEAHNAENTTRLASDKAYHESLTPAGQAKAAQAQHEVIRKEHMMDRGDGKPQPYFQVCPVCGHGTVREVKPGDYPHTPTGRQVCAYDPKHDLRAKAQPTE